MPAIVRAQLAGSKETKEFTPGGHLDVIYDLYGKRYSLGQLAVSKQAMPVGGGDSTYAAIPASCSSGYFQLYLAPGCGMDGTDAVSMARLNVLCRVLNDISAFISSPCATTGQKVNILVGSGLSGDALGVASPFFNMPSSLTASGIVDNTIWITLNSGKDAFTNVAAPMSSWASGSAGTAFYHGSIKFNFTGSIAWHTDLSTAPGAGEADLYSVALHEMMHAMGFATLIEYTGGSVFGGNYQYYGRYDRHLANTSGQSLITNSGSGGCGMYNWRFNPALAPAGATLSPGGMTACPSGFQTGSSADHTICSNRVEYTGGWSSAIPVYTPECFEKGSSLSHFEDECYVPSGFVLGPAGAATNNQYFTMSNSAPAGPYSATTNPGVMKRYPKPEERQVLCDIGYSVGTSYGSASSLNNYTYSGSACPGLGVVGINDGISPGGVYTYTTTVGTAVDINPATARFMSNDYGVTGGSFKCLEVVNGAGTLSVTSGTTATPVMFTPAAGVSGIQLLRYIPVSSTGAEGNITYLLVYVGQNCAVSACNMIVNGGFEDVQSSGGGSLLLANCWSPFAETPDLFERGCSTPWWCFPMYSMSRNNAVRPVDTVGNNHYIGIVAGSSTAPGYGSEAVQGQLSSGLINGEKYHVSFWARLSDIPVTSGIPSGFDTLDVHLLFTVGEAFPLIGYSSVLTSLPPDLNSLSDVVVTHPDIMWHYYDTTVTYTGPTGARSLVITQGPWIDSTTAWQEYLMLDDVSITPASTACSIHLPDTVYSNSIVHLDSFVSIAGGTYSWYADSAGTTVISHNGLLNGNAAYVASMAAGNGGKVSVCYKYVTTLGCALEVCDDMYIVYVPTGIGVAAIPTTPYDIKAVPNPATDDITITGNVGEAYNGNAVTITLTDMLGRSLLEETAVVKSGKVTKSISVSNIPAGQYLLRVKNSSVNSTIRVSVER